MSNVPAFKRNAPLAAAARPNIAKPSTPRLALSETLIAERAKNIWIAKGRPQGQDEQNWKEAEAQLKKELHLA